ncbi:response regulator [Siphonobacter sp.]|uniref:response regulator n=1 Tax=Siphonobacter sp. TaxID=1869184 RepID=UPI003B3B78EB
MRILIVEDELKLATSLKRGLDEYGFQASVALDGASAKKALELGEINLVILDINLPDINGYDLCRYIHERNSHIPIIILTALGTIENKLTGFDAGADDYLVKPFEFSELLARIQVSRKRTQHSSTSAAHSQLSIADLVLDLREKTVSRAGRPVNVTPREIALLEYFLRNQGTVLTRNEIAENVWDIPFDTGTNLIDVYINTLRKKIDKDFTTKLIHTRKGIGYIMKEMAE